MECNKIGERIAHLRKVKGISQADLAKAMYVKREVVTHWEKGDRDLKTEYTIKLADYFGVTCDYLLRGIPSENLDIAKATGLNNDSIEKLKRIHDMSELTHNASYSKAVNSLISSKNFIQFILALMDFQRKNEIAAYRLEKFAEWLIHHEIVPPKNLLEYAAKLAIEQSMPVAIDVMNSQEDVKYSLYKLQKNLDSIAYNTVDGGL